MKLRWNVHELAATSGVIASVLMFVSGLVHNTEGAAASSCHTMTAAVAEQWNRLIGTYRLMLAVFFLRFFVGYTHHHPVSPEDDFGWLSPTTMGGGLVACAMLLMAAHFSHSLSALSGYWAETQVAKALDVPDWKWCLLVEAMPFSAFIGSGSGYAPRTGEPPAWLN
jgi:hypothetical protein